jgi:predicted DNA-binding transcriptional regulator AlpA
MGTLPNTLTHLLNEYQVAELMGVSVATVRRWRLLRQGPRYLKIGAVAVRYRPEDLETWLTSRPTGGAEIPPVASGTARSVSTPTAATSRRGGARNVRA